MSDTDLQPAEEAAQEPGHGRQKGGKIAAAAVRVRARRSISPVWFIPLVALGVGIYVAWITLQSRGPTVEILFASAEGLEPDRTRIKFKDVDVGLVESVRLSEDLQTIRVTARMEQTIAPYLTDRASFWIVRPRVGVGGVSGLTTLLSGSFIEMDTTTGGAPQTSFEALEEPPLIRSDAPGRQFRLTAATLGSVSRGAPVFHRGVQVGQVLGYELAPEPDRVVTHIFVRAPFDGLVREATRFWNAGGISVSAGAEGYALEVPPLQALLAGGIEFETAEGGMAGQPATNGSTFHLYDSHQDVLNDVAGPTQDFLVYFESSVRGLRPGAPVEFRGIRVGTVTAVNLEVEMARQTIRIPVTLRIEPGRVRGRGEPLPGEPLESMRLLVERGLRAQLATASIITGDLYVALDFFPSLPQATLQQEGDLPQIPSVPSQFDQITASVSDTMDRIAGLPIEGLVEDLRATLTSFGQLAGGEQTQASLGAMEQALTRLASLGAVLEQDLPPTVATLREAANTASATLRDLRGTVSSVDEIVGSNSQLRHELTQALKQLSSAARSIRELADYLERNPSALIRGRQSSR